jgi:hypothetical protein
MQGSTIATFSTTHLYLLGVFVAAVGALAVWVRLFVNGDQSEQSTFEMHEDLDPEFPVDSILRADKYSPSRPRPSSIISPMIIRRNELMRRGGDLKEAELLECIGLDEVLSAAESKHNPREEA